MAKYGMAIDLKRCVGCGACALACKTENNTDIEQNGKRFNWADFYVTTEGKFAHGNVKHWVFPTLCNHCTNAPCIAACPTFPKALSKTADGITILDHDLCIGCGYCITHCPYSDHDVDAAKVQYSVITRNSAAHQPHVFYDNTTAIIPGCTATPAEVVTLVGERPPNMNTYSHPNTWDVRPKGVSEKCTFCIHRVTHGDEPYCNVSCPAEARLLGDLNDPGDEIHQWLAKGYVRLKNNKGEVIPQGAASDLQPNVYYISYDTSVGTPEHKPVAPPASMKVFPNPARDEVTLAFTSEIRGEAQLALFDISGKEVMSLRQTFDMEPGTITRSIHVSSLKPGTYIVRVAADKQVFTANLVKIR